MINLNVEENPKKSWELTLPHGPTVESLLSPGGILKNHNLKFKTNITSLSELSESEYFKETLENVIIAFDYLIKDRLDFFHRYKQKIEKIVIGQRLGQFLNEQPKNIKNLFQKSHHNILNNEYHISDCHEQGNGQKFSVKLVEN